MIRVMIRIGLKFGDMTLEGTPTYLWLRSWLYRYLPMAQGLAVDYLPVFQELAVVYLSALW